MKLYKEQVIILVALCVSVAIGIWFMMASADTAPTVDNQIPIPIEAPSNE